MAKLGDVIDGLELLAKHAGRDKHQIAAEHDLIYGPGVRPERLSGEDRATLERLGWGWDEEAESWYRFV